MNRFEHTIFLWGLAALPLMIGCLLFVLNWKKRTAAKIGDPRLVQQLTKYHAPGKFAFKFILFLLAFSSIVLGAANFQRPGEIQNTHRKGVDLMIVLDVSKSMLAEDIKPNRLERAKQLLLKLVDRLQNDRIGIVLFAGRPYMQMPLTIDHSAAKMYIQDAGPDVVPTQGTVIAEALQMANNAFNSKERKYKAMILISDGEDHDPDALKTAQQLAKEGVMINTVGIGSPEGSPIMDPVTREFKKDINGQTVISKLNEGELQQLSQATNGTYLRLDNNEDALITLSQQLDSIEKKSLTDSEYIDYKSYFQLFLSFGLLLLLIELLLPERKTITA